MVLMHLQECDPAIVHPPTALPGAAMSSRSGEFVLHLVAPCVQVRTDCRGDKGFGIFVLRERVCGSPTGVDEMQII